MNIDEAMNIAAANVRAFGGTYTVAQNKRGCYGVCASINALPRGWREVAIVDAYELRVRELQAEGMTRGDAQAVADAEAQS